MHIYICVIIIRNGGRSVGWSVGLCPFFLPIQILYFMHKLLFARDTKLAQANDDFWLELFVLFSPTKKAVRHIEILLMVCIYQKTEEAIKNQ